MIGLCNETFYSIQQQIAEYFSIFRELSVKRRTVGDILSIKETYDSVWRRDVHANTQEILHSKRLS
jgi:hypothetical protein